MIGGGERRWALKADTQVLDLPFINVILDDSASNGFFCLYKEG